MKNLLLWIWQLPQNLIGLFLIFIFKAKKQVPDASGIAYWVMDDKDSEVGRIVLFFRKLIHKYYPKHPDFDLFSGASLGEYIVLNDENMKDPFVSRHENGHSLQSKKWGWLYLLVIGIPSLLNNIRARSNSIIYKTYYQRYPEKEADILGGVIRKIQ